MAQNIKVTRETFGDDAKSVPLKKGRIDVFGHTINDGQPIPERGYSPNAKTGHPAASEDKK